MSDKPTIVPARNGPYLVTNCKMLKSFQDGTHQTNGFTGDKVPDRVPDKREDYASDGLVLHDNRGLCAHAGRCTDGLETVFKLDQEPFIVPKGATAEEIIKAVKSCPSGALSYSVDGVEHRDQDREPVIFIAPNGPYAIMAAPISRVSSGVRARHASTSTCAGAARARTSRSATVPTGITTSTSTRPSRSNAGLSASPDQPWVGLVASAEERPYVHRVQ